MENISTVFQQCTERKNAQRRTHMPNKRSANQTTVGNAAAAKRSGLLPFANESVTNAI